jgi:peptide/nickel transport system permease protein
MNVIRRHYFINNNINNIASGSIVIIVMVALITPYFTPYKDPEGWNYVPRDRPPSLQYLFGTNTLGQDVFWITIYSLRNSIQIGVIAALIGLSISLFVGVLAGLQKGLFSEVFTAIIDTFNLIPVFPILILVAVMWKQYLNVALVAIIIGSLGWGWAARIIRSMILSLKNRIFIQTAHFSGYKLHSMIFYEFMPYMLGWIVMAFLALFNMAIGLEAALGLIGLTSLEKASIGSTIFWSLSYQAFLRGIWWWFVFPTIFIVVLMVAIYTIANNVRRSLVGGGTI